jgi:hypothetical protein
LPQPSLEELEEEDDSEESEDELDDDSEESDDELEEDSLELREDELDEDSLELILEDELEDSLELVEEELELEPVPSSICTASYPSGRTKRGGSAFGLKVNAMWRSGCSHTNPSW